MGSTQSIHKLNYQDMQNIVNNNTTNGKYLIINTLDINNQDCLIKNTLSPENEIIELNKYINKNKNVNIVIYGENCTDRKVSNKYDDLISIHKFTNVYVYVGGLFEWLLLQDYYGEAHFPTTTIPITPLKYRGENILT
jgi:hypothetical protein